MCSFLAKPPHSGHKHNATAIIKKRISLLTDSSVVPAPAGETAQVVQPRRPRGSEESLAAAVSAKIEQGNLKAAVRILCSDEKPAPDNEATLRSLGAKHPPAPLDRCPFPPLSNNSLVVSVAEVLEAIRSFPNGSSGGMDGVKPQHLKDLVSSDDASNSLIPAITDFVNLLLAGSCPTEIRQYLFGGSCMPWRKKRGRPADSGEQPLEDIGGEN